MKRYLWGMLLSIFATAALALESSDTGTYAVVHKDGHVTDFTFFVSMNKGFWNIEQKEKNGHWKPVTCERECELRISSQQDIQRLIPTRTLEKIKPTCVHNTAFAFCEYVLNSAPANKKYVLIALVSGHPTPISLKKIANHRQD